MRKSELIQDALDDGHNEDTQNDSPFVFPRILDECAKPDNKQKSREWRQKLRRKLKKSTEVQTFYKFPDNGLALF